MMNNLKLVIYLATSLVALTGCNLLTTDLRDLVANPMAIDSVDNNQQNFS